MEIRKIYHLDISSEKVLTTIADNTAVNPAYLPIGEAMKIAAEQQSKDFFGRVGESRFDVEYLPSIGNTSRRRGNLFSSYLHATVENDDKGCVVKTEFRLSKMQKFLVWVVYFTAVGSMLILAPSFFNAEFDLLFATFYSAILIAFLLFFTLYGKKLDREGREQLDKFFMDLFGQNIVDQKEEFVDSYRDPDVEELKDPGQETSPARIFVALLIAIISIAIVVVGMAYIFVYRG